MIDELKNWVAGKEFLKERPSGDCPAFNCTPAAVPEFLRQLRDDLGFNFLTDVTAIDHYDQSPRFEVVYHLLNIDSGMYVRVVTPCVGDAEPVCPSVTHLWPAADWHERETYDMFGIRFEGHPDLRRILMWDEYPYFPLRKEFPLAGEEVDLPAADVVERTGVKVKPAPMMGGPFHSSQTGSMARREPRADDESWTEVKSREGIEKSDRPREFQKGES